MNLRDVKTKENREGAISYFCINLYTQRPRIGIKLGMCNDRHINPVSVM